MFNFKSFVPLRSKTMDVESTTDLPFQPSTSPSLSARDDFDSEDDDEEVELLTTEVKITHPVPSEKRQQWIYRQLRHVFFTVYRRLFTAVLLINLAGFLVVASKPYNLEFLLEVVSSVASANLFVAFLVRQDYFINLIFGICGLTPKWAPLRLRRIMAKVYEFGGVHSGAAFCSTLWFTGLTVLLTINFINGDLPNIPILALAYGLLVLLFAILISAHPALRNRFHNTFERTHRFAGWTANILFWVLTVLSASSIASRSPTPKSTISILVIQPSFYFLTVNTLHIAIPWLRLRKVSTTATTLSSHALRLHLAETIAPLCTIRISDSPFSEWHSFACFPDNNAATHSLIISNAGDWTSKTIANPRPYYWTRGLPTRGVLYSSLIFKRVVIVTTGSGIGPCLNLLGMDEAARPACRVLWSTPSPQETFGKEVCSVVRACDPQAVIWDTRKSGRPDMLALTWQLVMEFDAEAVFVISNPKVTKSVVYGLESRGVAAYGPIFDS